MESHSLPPDEAATALGLVTSSRVGLADRLVTPWWYHPALGLLAGGLVLSSAADSDVVLAVAVALYGVGLAVLTAAVKRRSGVWVDGFAPGRARRWAVAVGALLVVAMLLAVVTRNALDVVWPTVALALAVLAGTVALGRLHDRDRRAELREPLPTR